MKTLYKFVSSRSAVESLSRGFLKFARIEDLNDSTELAPYMNREAVRTTLSAIRKSGYSPFQFDWLGHQEALLRLLSPETRALARPRTIDDANRILSLAIYDNLDYMEKQLLETIRLIRSRVGVLSLTSRFDSLPMWAHYAALAAGYVVRFQNLESEFSGDATGSLNFPKPVNYVDDLLGMTHDPSTQDNLFFTKFRDWNYENEWRIVTALSSCRTSKNNNLFLRSIQPETVTGVICGWNLPNEQKHSLAANLRTINPGLEVQAAFLDRGHVRVRPLDAT